MYAVTCSWCGAILTNVEKHIGDLCASCGEFEEDICSSCGCAPVSSTGSELCVDCKSAEESTGVEITCEVESRLVANILLTMHPEDLDEVIEETLSHLSPEEREYVNDFVIHSL